MKRTARSSPPSPRPNKGPQAEDKNLRPGASGARAVAHSVLVRVDTQAAYGGRALDAALKRAQLADSDRALATELVYGTLRHGPALDAALGEYLSSPMQRLPIPVRCALRLGAYQLLHMRVPAYSAVNESVTLVGARYGVLAGLVNAVLRRLAAATAQAAAAEPAHAGSLNRQLPDPSDGQAMEAYGAATSHPPWLVQRLMAQLGADGAQACVAANNRPPKLSLRVNLCKTSREDLQERLMQRGVAAQCSPHCPETLLLPPAGAIAELPGYSDGHFAVQDGAATLVGHLLAPPSGATVFDLCAAPGGKSAHAFELMAGQGRVVAVDVHPGRSSLIAKNAARLGHAGISAVVADVAEPGALAAVCAEAGVSGIDYALLDAPCSALGTLRRHPELRRSDGTSVPRLAALQAQLLDAAAACMAPGGVLVYAVCTVTEEEGPQQVAAFLARWPEFRLAPLPDALTAYADGNLGALRTWPHRHDLDGFFAARLVRDAITLRPLGANP